MKIPNAVELAWDYAHDARDRLIRNLKLNEEYVEEITKRIEYVLNSIGEQYGEGMYNSWEVKFSNVVCTICQQDIRGCDHIPGHWYDDMQCRYKADKLELVASAIVDNPRDPRCRIWPWKIEKKDGVIFDVPMFKLFELAGHNNDAGEVVDTDSLFPCVKNILQHPRQRTRYEVYAYRKLKRQELIDTVRKCVAQHEIDTAGIRRIKFYTLIGSDHRRRLRQDDSKDIAV